jgi:phosphoenolpyruvate---glycerone phosphotransferase subunit DhaM
VVGIVIVSHSQKIAEGIVELTTPMANPDLKIIAAGGTSDGRIGTDAMRIMEAIIEADDGDGVLVMVDLGSAVISTETAFDFLEDELRRRVKIADAPVVEGAFVAAVEASIGSSIDKVKQTAEEARELHKV